MRATTKDELEFDYSDETKNHDNQRIVLFHALDEAERALRVIEAPKDCWTFPHAVTVVSAIETTLKKGKDVNLFTVSEELRALGAGNALSTLPIDGMSFVAEFAWTDALESVLAWRDRKARYSFLLWSSDQLNKHSSFEEWDSVVLNELMKLQKKTKFITGATDTENIRREVELIKSGEDRKGFIQVGFPELDDKTDGFGPGQLVVLAAWPGGGKTTFAVQLATHIAKNYGPVYFEELEMNLRELARRRISTITGAKINEWTPEELEKALERSSDTENLYYECAGGKLDQFLNRIHRRMLLIPDTKAVFVDYMGLLQNFGKGYNDTSEAGAVSDALKHVAQHYQILVIAMQQPNRNVDGRPNKRPRTSDLRDSNKIVQDAHKILFLYKPSEHEDDAPKGLVECHVLKDRQGKSGGFVQLNWRSSVFRFEAWNDKETVGPKRVYSKEESKMAGRFPGISMDTKKRLGKVEFEELDEAMNEIGKADLF